MLFRSVSQSRYKGGNANSERLSQLEKLKQYYEQADMTYRSTKEKSLSQVDVDPNSVRGSLYTTSYLETMSRALSPKDTSIKYEESAPFKIKMEVDRFNETLKQNAISNRFRQQELDLARTNKISKNQKRE